MGNMGAAHKRMGNAVLMGYTAVLKDTVVVVGVSAPKEHYNIQWLP
jgi:hypothetical protein